MQHHKILYETLTLRAKIKVWRDGQYSLHEINSVIELAQPHLTLMIDSAIPADVQVPGDEGVMMVGGGILASILAFLNTDLGKQLSAFLMDLIKNLLSGA